MLYLFCLLHSGVFYATAVEIAKRHTNDRKYRKTIFSTYVLRILNFRDYIALRLYLFRLLRSRLFLHPLHLTIFVFICII